MSGFEDGMARDFLGELGFFPDDGITQPTESPLNKTRYERRYHGDGTKSMNIANQAGHMSILVKFSS